MLTSLTVTGGALPTRKAVPLRQAGEHSSYSQRVTTMSSNRAISGAVGSTFGRRIGCRGLFPSSQLYGIGYRRRAATEK